MNGNFKAIQCVAVTIALAVAVGGCSGGAHLVLEDEPAGQIVYGQSGKFTLVEDENYGHAIVDREGTPLWETTYSGYEDDEIAEGSIKNEMRSELVVYYVDGTDASFMSTSYISCVRQDTVTSEKVEGGFKVTYDFSREKEQFKVPVLMRMTENYLEAQILFSEIEEYGETRVSEVRLFPYMCVATPAHDGYMFIPDGSGALSEFKKVSPLAGIYEEPVYGRDDALTTAVISSPVQKIRLPVYGIKKDDQALLALVSKGDAVSLIKALPAGRLSEASAVSASFVRIQRERMVIAGQERVSKEISIAADAVTTVDPVVRFYPLSGEKADYYGMAEAYRTYLISEKNQKKIEAGEHTPLELELFGGAKTKSSFLGFIYDKLQVATTLADVDKIVRLLKENGVGDISAHLFGFEKGGMKHAISHEFSIDGKFGGTKALGNLKAADGLAIYPAADFFNAYALPFMHFKHNTAATAITFEKLEKSVVSRSTGIGSEYFSSWFLVKPSAAYGYADSYQASFNKHGMRQVLLEYVGDSVYSDYDKSDFTDRNRTIQVYAEIVDAFKEKNVTVAVDGGNAYAAVLCDKVIEAPQEDSKFSLSTARVPFYQIVFHGLKQLSGEPVNAAPDRRRAMLLNLETGMNPLYRLTGTSTERLAKSSLEFLLNTEYTLWLDEIQANYREYDSLHAGLQDQLIVGHTTMDGLTVTTYENGTRIAVNLSETAQTYENTEIPPYDYQVLE